MSALITKLYNLYFLFWIMDIDVNDSNFEKEVIEKSKDTPVLVQFWASWCGPCQMLKPVLERVSADYDDKFILARMSVEANQVVPGAYGIMSIPAVKLFKDGKVVDEFIGARPEAAVRSWLDERI